MPGKRRSASSSAPPPPAHQRNLMKELLPVMSFSGAICGVIIWCYSTFATQTQLRENVDQLKSMIKETHETSIQHSDMNRDRMMTAIDGLREALRAIDSRLRDKD